MGASDDEWALRLRMREAVELLARGWPEEYPASSVEWMMVASAST